MMLKTWSDFIPTLNHKWSICRRNATWSKDAREETDHTLDIRSCSQDEGFNHHYHRYDDSSSSIPGSSFPSSLIWQGVANVSDLATNTHAQASSRKFTMSVSISCLTIVVQEALSGK
ncbi:hypothetical protein EYR41_004754 [Orbilia oligospora]|uniref:Uncharacterized protein n=1 Tax=Orbilia oligospora TaxID=2813651 RepID=A0A7C8PGI9_ORBOL|nr:hypothetical protein TWF751_001605 [Orbilia oligospora]TGJ68661.1 hypothetical protein EYR41_004754 [Orbilia oligospora]